eukprot:Em0015g928a
MLHEVRSPDCMGDMQHPHYSELRLDIGLSDAIVSKSFKLEAEDYWTKLFSDPVINSSSTFVGGLNTAAAGFQYGMVLTIAIQSSGAFTSQVTALTSLDYTYSLYYYDSSSTLQYGRNGFETIEGYPLQGKPLAIYVQPNAYTDGSAAVLSSITLLSDVSGLPMDSQLLNDAGNGAYIGLLAVPSQPFRIQVIGKDASGNYLSRIGSTIRPSDIEFTLGNDAYPLMLLPGERKSRTLLLHNYGSEDTFVVSVTADKDVTFTFSTVRNITISHLETVSFDISVLASGIATDGFSTLVTVTAASQNRMNTVKFVAVFAVDSVFHYNTEEFLFNEQKPVPTMTSGWIHRWALTLSAYKYHMEYRAGKDQGNVDVLRLPVGEAPLEVPIPGDTVLMLQMLSDANSMVTASAIRKWTNTDPLLSMVRRMVLQGWESQLEPEFKPYMQWRAPILRLLHEGHPGISRMKALARSVVWWPGLDAELDNKAMRVLRHTFATHGLPDILVSDNGTAFTSAEFQFFAKAMVSNI